MWSSSGVSVLYLFRLCSLNVKTAALGLMPGIDCSLIREEDREASLHGLHLCLPAIGIDVLAKAFCAKKSASDALDILGVSSCPEVGPRGHGLVIRRRCWRTAVRKSCRHAVLDVGVVVGLPLGRTGRLLSPGAARALIHSSLS